MLSGWSLAAAISLKPGPLPGVYATPGDASAPPGPPFPIIGSAHSRPAALIIFAIRARKIRRFISTCQDVPVENNTAAIN